MIVFLVKKIKYFLRRRKVKRIKSSLNFCGKYVDLSYDCVIYHTKRVVIEDYVYIGPGGEINALGGVLIERGSIIGPNIFIHSANHNFLGAKYLPYDETHVFKKVVIQKNVWIGANVSIVPGVVIGEGAIVGMGSVVTKDVPKCAIIGGNPAKILKYRDINVYDELCKEDMVYMKYKKHNGLESDLDSGYINDFIS